jgi:LacI family transcriptional regulator
VARAAKRLNYVPNQLARSLSLGQTNLIGLVTPPIVIMTPQGHALSRIEMLARGDGKRLVHLNYDRSEGSTLLNTVLEQHWRGMLLFPNTPREETAELARSLRKYGVPMVVMGGTGLEDADCVNVDAAYGIHLLVRHAHERGLRRAAVLGYSGEVGSLSTSPKFHTLEADLSNCGMDLASVASYEEMHSHGPRLYRVAYEAFDGALRQGLKADWVIGANDVIAVAAMNCLCARGYRVPEDIAVSGYDDT